MINYFLLLDKNQTTDQKVVSSNPAGCAIKKPSPRRVFLWRSAVLLTSKESDSDRGEMYKTNDCRAVKAQ